MQAVIGGDRDEVAERGELQISVEPKHSATWYMQQAVARDEPGAFSVRDFLVVLVGTTTFRFRLPAQGETS